MEQTKENLKHDYNLAVESFNNKDYSSFFRNIRPAIEGLSQFLIFDFLNNEVEALDLINGDASIIKQRDNTYKYSIYPANIPPVGGKLCELFPVTYFSKHNDITTKGTTPQNQRIKQGLSSCGAELRRYYSIASEAGSHAARTLMDKEIQAKGCAAFIMGLFDYLKSNSIISNSAITFLNQLDVFAFGEVVNTTDYQRQIDNLIKEAEEKEAALLAAQKMQLEAEKNRLSAEQRTSEVEKQNQELEEQIKLLQEKLDSQTIVVDLYKEEASEETEESTPIAVIENEKMNREQEGGQDIIRSHAFRAALQGNAWDVSEETMDDNQLDLIEYTDDKSMLVAGCAGSGKSVIAMHKAEQLYKKGKDVILIAYTKSLSRFMKNGTDEPAFKFYHHYYWKYRLHMPKADYIIVDEIQDFTKEEIKEFITAARKHFLFFGDTAQSIYRQYGKQTMTIEEIATMTGLNPLQLFNNYRLPRPVAKITQDYVGVGVQEYKERVYQNKKTELPHFVHFDSDEKQIEALLKLTIDNAGRKVGILTPSNQDVIRLGQEFQTNNIEYEFKYNKSENDIEYVDTLDFNTLLPKILTYHSAKGLQFDMVILPFYNGANDDESKKALYVAMTRTMHTLYILYSTPTLLPPLNRVPSHLYLKE